MKQIILSLMVTVSIITSSFVLTQAASQSQATWQEKWDKTVVDAKKEGAVSAYSAGWGPATRTALTEAFKGRYGITLEFTAFGRGAEMVARVEKEKAAGLNIADFFPTGTGTLLTIMKPKNLLGNMEPLLILPEVTDPKVWLGGELPFVDKAKTAFTMTASLTRHIIYNTGMVRKGEITSFKDLLKPQYKGKITMNDPTATGPGNAMMSYLARTVWNLEEAKAFLTQLIKEQEVFIQKDSRLHVESVARGKFAIGLAPWPDVLTGFMKVGAPVAVVILERTSVTSGAGVLGVPTTLVHPNATRLFLNWLLTREGQTILAKSYGIPSRRLDVPKEGINPAFLQHPGEMLIMETEEGVKFQGQMLKIVAQVIKEARK